MFVLLVVFFSNVLDFNKWIIVDQLHSESKNIDIMYVFLFTLYCGEIYLMKYVYEKNGDFKAMLYAWNVQTIVQRIQYLRKSKYENESNTRPYREKKEYQLKKKNSNKQQQKKIRRHYKLRKSFYYYIFKYKNWILLNNVIKHRHFKNKMQNILMNLKRFSKKICLCKKYHSFSNSENHLLHQRNIFAIKITETNILLFQCQISLLLS